MPAALLPREEIVARLHDVFRGEGFDGASLAHISDATGLGKSSLYYYFPGGKDEMAVAVLERIVAWLDTNALAPLRGPGTPKTRLRSMLRVLDEFYVGGRNACVLGNLVVGASREKFQTRLAAAFGRWIEALRVLAVEAGVPEPQAREHAEDAVVRIEGALILAGGLGETGAFKRALGNIERELLGQTKNAANLA